MKFLFPILLCFVLCGCVRVGQNVETAPKENPEIIEKKDQKDKTMTCQKQDETLKFEAKGEEIHKMIQSFYMNLEELGVTKDMNHDEILVTINQTLEDMYRDLHGVDAKGEIEGDKVKITVTIDYEKADKKELMDKGLLTGGEKDSLYISFSETKKDYVNNGYSCEIE